MNAFRTVLTAAAATFALAAPAQSTWHIETAHSSVEFQIRHLGVSNVHGSLNGVTGEVVWDEKNIANSHVAATIDAKTISTGNDKRDAHLKSPDFFNVDKYPTLTFKSTSVKRTGDGKLQIVGDLTLAGQTKPVTLDVDGPATPQQAQGKTMSGFSATGTIKRSDFNFGQKYTAPTLGDDVKFTIDLEVSK